MSPPYLLLLFLLSLAVVQATHIEIFRHPANHHLQASISQYYEDDENAYIYNTERDLVIMFDDTTTVIMERVFDDLVYVNVNQEHLYTCFFPAEPRDVVVIHIFKEEQIKIAEAARSMCIPVNKVKYEEKTKRRYKNSPLRHEI